MYIFKWFASSSSNNNNVLSAANATRTRLEVLLRLFLDPRLRPLYIVGPGVDSIDGVTSQVKGGGEEGGASRSGNSIDSIVVSSIYLVKMKAWEQLE
jgi:hypothetical protein